ncbi:hypothetical protein SAMD00019534_006700 [Acytostelium subglobosum LB1]|uniref:hypothetical protein n=1 Tax=Acytostelium subglobosum LB1 TaxID=1410327 RepID=UPI000644D41D|nr:hypothetical protein SAMD00019534_006700 [Acytostelium subglobosum LB1]GAM17495.1 hypothetical protein SAMD00019534_006700 [Acytostelium subglobosum LB1]|eukprot:XP_012759557.1 hypothetical protein SAMD00019534_006700 [Acytostelium subglobosum LB1]
MENDNIVEIEDDEGQVKVIDTLAQENDDQDDDQEKSTDILPNQTLYVSNLAEKPSKTKLTEQLYSLCTRYGSILDIVVSKKQKLRGQAFIVFKDITAASNALRELNGFDLLGRPMRVAYCKTKSDAVSKLDGTYMEKKRERETNKEKKKVKKQDTKKPPRPRPATTPAANTLQPRDEPPNRILFIENLPDKCETVMIQMLFSQFQGFQTVNMPTAKKGIAFVEFDDEVKSGVAMNHLQGFKVLPEKPMVISYAAQ